ncbi:uncharacterized protein PV09_05636 [Verruconis gallopava]|uniref:Uncharacterized protein n=1 Tax=Verruconis gallopava TaxID=253628 RepID=A0A0D2A8U2_9PEZI|nr:uncharacterized protein PV09_05636 [Verruconis gallopava]KIW02975.1 hypothetical protein PV09_05636 [Verruconis gallopava]
MSLATFVTVDVFTRQKYAGNQLAIVHVPAEGLTQDQKQAIAREFGYSETTFVHPQKDGGKNEWVVDIFTLDQELPFAGHPTIGTAIHLLSPLAGHGARTVSGSFNLKAGPVQLTYDAIEKTAEAAIPHNVHVHKARYSSTELMKLQPKVGRLPDQSPVVSIVAGMTYVLAELDSLDSLTFVNPTPYPIEPQLDGGRNESFVGCYFYVLQSDDVGDGVIRLRTRMIESCVGEDPATGSAACTLACYLAMQQRKPGTTSRYKITQGVEMGRRSEIGVVVTTDTSGKIQSVRLSGAAVKVLEGKLSL